MSDGNSISIRRARRDEAQELTEIAMRSKQSNGYDDSFMDACADELKVSEARIEHGEYWVAEQGTLCGFVSLTIDTNREVAHLQSLFIGPDWQRKGVGKRLWLKVRQSALSKGIRKIQLDSDPSAVPFYESLGFKTVASVPSGSIKGRLIPRMETCLQ